MPYRPKRPCSYPGCPELVASTEKYCDKHRRQRHREYKARRTDSEEQAFYKSGRWKKLRDWKFRHEPLCEMCLQEGRTTPAVMVHHRQEIKSGGSPMSVDNLMSLCKACHNRLHGAKR